MVVCRTDLDEPLEEHLRLAGLPFPEILQDLVGLEEVFFVEEPDALVDRVQAGRRIRFPHARRKGAALIKIPPHRGGGRLRPGKEWFGRPSPRAFPGCLQSCVMGSEARQLTCECCYVC